MVIISEILEEGLSTNNGRPITTSGDQDQADGTSQGLASQDVVPYVAPSGPSTEVPVQNPGYSDERLQLLIQAVHFSVNTTIREVKSLYETGEQPQQPPQAILAQPLNYIPAAQHNNDAEMKAEGKGKKRKAQIAGEMNISFNLTNGLVKEAIDIDKFPLPEEKRKARRFTVNRKLADWKVQRRQRVNGKFDWYYYHYESGALFRSAMEVTNFILFETFPGKGQGQGQGQERSKGRKKASKEKIAMEAERGSMSKAESGGASKAEDGGKEKEEHSGTAKEEHSGAAKEESGGAEKEELVDGMSDFDEDEKEVVRFYMEAYENYMAGDYVVTAGEPEWSDEEEEAEAKGIPKNDGSGSADGVENLVRFTALVPLGIQKPVMRPGGITLTHIP